MKEEGRVIGVKKLFGRIKRRWDHKSCSRDLLALKFEYFNLWSTTAKKRGKLLGVASLRRFVRFHLDFLKVVRLVFWSGVVGPGECWDEDRMNY